MKYLIIISFLFFSCKKERPKENIVYNIDQWYNTYENNSTTNIKVVDTNCINQTKRAIEDIKNDKLVYFSQDVLFGAGEMKKLLRVENIEFKSYLSSCFEPPPGFEMYCYKNIMHCEIDMRYGSDFIDSLWVEADKNTMLKYPDSIYIKNGRDIREKYIDLQ